jgi:hypothetical protein
VDKQKVFGVALAFSRTQFGRLAAAFHPGKQACGRRFGPPVTCITSIPLPLCDMQQSRVLPAPSGGGLLNTDEGRDCLSVVHRDKPNDNLSRLRLRTN